MSIVAAAPIPTLETPRLVLRALAPGDAATLFPVYSDPDTMRWWSCAPFKSIPALADWLAPGSDRLSWIICLEGEAIGRTSLREHRPGVAELGYLVGRAHWGRGLAREAAEAVIDHAFTVLALRRIFADTDPDNTASIGALVALGFTLEGRLREEWETHIGVRDSLIFGMLRTDWAARSR